MDKTEDLYQATFTPEGKLRNVRRIRPGAARSHVVTEQWARAAEGGVAREPKPHGLAGPLTPRQSDLLDFIETYIAEHRYAPSYAEMRRALSIRSQSAIAQMIAGLKSAGFISIGARGRARNISLTI